MVIDESGGGGVADGPHIETDAGNPEGLYFTDQK